MKTGTALIGDDALTWLARYQEQPEDSQSSYWREEVRTFQIDPSSGIVGHTVVGSLTTKRGRLRAVAHWLLQTPHRIIGTRFRSFGDTVRLARDIARAQGRQFTHDIMRQVLALSLIRDRYEFADDRDASLVIGDGYGVMSALLLRAYPTRKVIVVNLTKSLLLDLTYMNKAVPEAKYALVTNAEQMREALSDPEIRAIAVRADDADAIRGAPIGLAVNIVSMQEMDLPVIHRYFDILRTSPGVRTAFFCSNSLTKTLYDGSEIRFEDYSWRPTDRIIADGVSRGHQWYYSKRFPFLHCKTGTGWIVWDRLAILEKDPAPGTWPDRPDKSAPRND